MSRGAVVALLLAVCTPPTMAAEPPTATPTTESILTSASQRLAQTQTVRFTLDIDGETFIDDAESIQLLEAQGLLVRPDRVQTDFKIRVLDSVTVSTSLITVGDQTWSTDLITGQWGPAPIEFGYDPGILFDNQGGIGPVIDRIQNATRLPEEELRGRDSYRFRAEVTQEIVGPLTMNTLRGAPITVDLWIDVESLDLLRARLAEPGGGDHDPAIWTLDLEDHDADLTIDPPA
jgi:hypothetical protein